MTTRMELRILSQPDDSTCGPTCLHAVYDFFGDALELSQVIDEVTALKAGGTLAVYLASHALARGYKATIYTYNLQVFDPTWFAKQEGESGAERHERMARRLKLQADATSDRKLREASMAYIEYLKLGGRLKFADLTPGLIKRILLRDTPILTGLSATYLYRSMRERGEDDDDVRGKPSGHFVVLSGYDEANKTVHVADPLLPNDYAGHEQYYEVEIPRLICSILLGIVTHDANLLVLEPEGYSDADAQAGVKRK